MDRIQLRPGQSVTIEVPLRPIDNRYFGGDPFLIKPVREEERAALGRFRGLVSNYPGIFIGGLEATPEDSGLLDTVMTREMLEDIKAGRINRRQAVELGTRVLVQAGAEKGLAKTAVARFYDRAAYSAESIK